MKKTTLKSAKTLAFTALFVALITVGAYISIPIAPIAFTLQTLFVLLSGALLGGINGMVCVLIYIFMGLIGLPVFTGGGAGFSYVLKPTFGFLIGFVFASLSVGLIAGKNPKVSTKRLSFALLFGTLIIYFFGVLYYLIIQKFYFGNAVDIKFVLWAFWIIFIPSDLLKGVLAFFTAKKVLPVIYK